MTTIYKHHSETNVHEKLHLSSTLPKFMEKLNIHRFKNYIPIKWSSHNNNALIFHEVHLH